MKAHISILLVLLTTSLLRAQSDSAHKYTLVNQGGVRVERFRNDTDENRYNYNNTVFVPGRAFTYAFEHTSADGTVFYFADDPSVKETENAWKFVRADSMDAQTIRFVKITVNYGLQPMIQHSPKYNQTVLSYYYLKGENREKAGFASSSGAIENEANVWIHPPRDKYFRMLELNPFPFVKFPPKADHTWKWKLDVGSRWGDPRWKTWEGTQHIRYTYRIAGQEKIKTVFGELECWVVQARATCAIGQTELVSYFHPRYGFVRLRYVNIDGSKTDLELVSLEGGY